MHDNAYSININTQNLLWLQHFFFLFFFCKLSSLQALFTHSGPDVTFFHPTFSKKKVSSWGKKKYLSALLQKWNGKVGDHNGRLLSSWYGKLNSQIIPSEEKKEKRHFILLLFHMSFISRNTEFWSLVVPVIILVILTYCFYIYLSVFILLLMPSSFMLMGDCRVLYISQYLSATSLTQISRSAVSGHIHLQQRLITSPELHTNNAWRSQPPKPPVSTTSHVTATPHLLKWRVWVWRTTEHKPSSNTYFCIVSDS